MFNFILEMEKSLERDGKSTERHRRRQHRYSFICFHGNDSAERPGPDRLLPAHCQLGDSAQFGRQDDFEVGAGDAGCGQQLLLCPVAFL